MTPKTAMREDAAKSLLAAYGIPVVCETAATSPEAAVSAAAALGFPVVLKGLGERLLHKTERNLVHLNLGSADQVQASARALQASAGADLEGFLVQRQIFGRRELVAGVMQDPQFGPVVMFGLGGIFTEALSDVVFRVAPLTAADAAEMLDEIRSRALLGPFRGEAAVNREQAVAALLGLSRLAVERRDIREVDINPLIVTPRGELVAVDALVVTAPAPADSGSRQLPPVDPLLLGKLFQPRSVAFVGASATLGKWGHQLFTAVKSGGFAGPIHLVNQRGGVIAGQPVYRSVAELPAGVDLAVVTVPAAAVVDLIPQLAARKIRNALLISSGFGETGPEGKALEAALTAAAHRSGVLVVGPNTMGICNPHIRFYCTPGQIMPAAGSTTVVAQSGNMGTQLLAFAESQGIGIRAYCGSGNEAMVTIEDYFDALAQDPVTRTVMVYLESVKDGRRFLESARRLGRSKPVVLLKGGQSRAGNRAAASHTGTMGSDARVFDAVCRQAGIIKVDQPMELLDLAAAFSALPLPRGKRVAIITLGGGWGVVTTDLCERCGLQVPPLPQALVERIDTLLPPFWSRANPVDVVGTGDFATPMAVMEALLGWDGCDAVITLGIIGRRVLQERALDAVLKSDPSYSAEFIAATRSRLAKFERDFIQQTVRLMTQHQKPVVGVRLLSAPGDRSLYPLAGCPHQALFFETPEQAVKSLARMCEYQRFLKRAV